MTLTEFDRQYTGVVCGVDEAGRGPLAGPVCVAACILPQDCQIEGLNDSKKLTPKKRDALFDAICASAVEYKIILIDEKTIDEINILQATLLGMKQAIEQLQHVPDMALIDGNKCPDTAISCQAVVKGDGKSASVAAAIILAKVTRDRIMEQYAQVYPGYGFAKHKGYGTKLHYEAIRQLGVCPIHRKSFLKKMH